MTAKTVLAAIVIAIVALILITVILTFCKAERYKVICQKGLFTNVKSSYKVGAKVKIYFPLVATDTDYKFYDNVENADYSYSDAEGYIISFIMPAHDVELRVESKNSMEPAVDTFPAGTMLLTYSERVSSAEGDSVYKVTVEATEKTWEHLMTVSREDRSKTGYIIPSWVYMHCKDYISDEEIWSWNELEHSNSVDGKVVTLSFLLDEKAVCVSSDQMPENGEKVLDYLHGILSEYMTDQYKCE